MKTQTILEEHGWEDTFLKEESSYGIGLEMKNFEIEASRLEKKIRPLFEVRGLYYLSQKLTAEIWAMLQLILNTKKQ